MLHSSGGGRGGGCGGGWGIRIVNNHDAGDHSIHWLITAHMPNGGHQRASHNFYWSQFWWEIAAAARSAIACYGGCWQSQRPDHTINGEATTGETGSKLDSYITAHSHDILFPWQKNVKLWPFAHDHVGPKLHWECWSNWERLLWCWVGILAVGLHFLKPTLPPCSLPLFNENRKMKISPFTRTFLLLLSWYEIPSPCVNGKEMWVAST